jgi:hypothetical protein
MTDDIDRAVSKVQFQMLRQVVSHYVYCERRCYTLGRAVDDISIEVFEKWSFFKSSYQ